MTYIVEDYLTVDLHIHSNFSNETKVGEPKQLKDTVNNVDVLINDCILLIECFSSFSFH